VGWSNGEIEPAAVPSAAGVDGQDSRWEMQISHRRKSLTVQLYTVKQTAEQLNASSSFVYGLITSGRLKHYVLGAGRGDERVSDAHLPIPSGEPMNETTSSTRSPIDSPYLTAVEAATYLRTTVQGIYALVKRARLKPMPGSGKLLFTREACDECLRKRRR
jgi:excisionase family DNA binding protein